MHIPNGYTVKARFPQHGWRATLMVVIAVLILVLLFPEFAKLTKNIHSDFDLAKSRAKFDSGTMQLILIMGPFFFAYIHTYIHEKIHQSCWRIFLGLWPELHMNLPLPNVTLPVGIVATRNKAIIASLSPLILLEILGVVILWLVGSNDSLSLIIFFLSANVGMAANDMIQSLWLLRRPSNYYFGFDGQDSVLYGP